MNNLLLKEKIFETIKSEINISNFVDFDINGFHESKSYLYLYLSKINNKEDAFKELLNNNILSELNEENYNNLRTSSYIFGLKSLFESNIQNIYHFKKDFGQTNSVNILKNIIEDKELLKNNYNNIWFKSYIEHSFKSFNPQLKEEIKSIYSRKILEHYDIYSTEYKETGDLNKLLSISKIFFKDNEIKKLHITGAIRAITRDQKELSKESFIYLLKNIDFFNSSKDFFIELTKEMEREKSRYNYYTSNKDVYINDFLLKNFKKYLNFDGLKNLNKTIQKESKPKLSSYIKSYFKKISFFEQVIYPTFFLNGLIFGLLSIHPVFMLIGLLNALPLILLSVIGPNDKTMIENFKDFIKIKKDSFIKVSNLDNGAYYKKYLYENIKNYLLSQNVDLKTNNKLSSIEEYFENKNNNLDDIDKLNKTISLLSNQELVENKKNVNLKNKDIYPSFEKFIKNLPQSNQEFKKIDTLLDKDKDLKNSLSYAKFLETAKEILSMEFKDDEKSQIDDEIQSIIIKYREKLEEQFIDEFDKKKSRLEILKKSI